MFYHLFTKSFGQIIRWLYFRAWTKNMKTIPKRGPAIVASNHLAVIDSIVLPTVVWRKIWFIGKKEYFQTGTLKQRLQKWFFTSVSVYPVDRAGGQAAQEALAVGRRAIEAGHLFGIYPEGTRSPDGRLYKGRTGVAKLALETRVPVVPVAMIGSQHAQPPGQTIPSPKRIGCIFADSLCFEEYYDIYDIAVKNSDAQEVHRILREVTDLIMHELYKVSGQEYVDIYATQAKDLLKQQVDINQWATDNDVKVLPARERAITCPKCV